MSARRYNGSNRHQQDFSSLTGHPVTFIAWAKSTNTSDPQFIWNIQGAQPDTIYNSWLLAFGGHLQFDPIYFWAAGTSQAGNFAQSNRSYLFDEWTHLAGLASDTGYLSCLIDGGDEGNAANSYQPENPTYVTIGGVEGINLEGDIEACAIYDIEMDDWHVASFFDHGFSPLMVFRHALKHYPELDSLYDTEQLSIRDLMTGQTFYHAGGDVPQIVASSQKTRIQPRAALVC